ncbi:MAG: LamG-like jellyroll fold domain-containing protein [Frankiaceae bacterium]
MSQPVITLRGDLTGTAFGSAPTYTDYTSYLEVGSDGAPVDVTWGRQDNRADVPPAQASFLLNNTDGRFTVGASIVELGHVFNVRVTANGVTTDRFTGYVTSVEPTWPGGVQSWSIVRVTCVDVTAKLSTGVPLRSMVEQEMLADAPALLYPLSDNGPYAGNVGSSSAPALVEASGTSGAGSVTFSTTTALFAAPNGVAFDGPTPGLGTAGAGSILTADFISTVPTGSSFTVEFWWQSATAPSSAYIPFHMDSNFVGGSISNIAECFFQITASTVVFTHAFPSQNKSATATANVNDGQPHLIAGTYSSAGLTLYIDGVQRATVSPIIARTFRYLNVGGKRVLGAGDITGVSKGTIAKVAITPSILSAARLLTHYQLGAGTFAESSTARFTRLAGYGKITTSGLPTGVATMGVQDTAGRTALDCLLEVGRTEGGAVYANGTGALTFTRRDARYNQTAAVTFTGYDLGSDTPVRKDMQDFFNELTATRVGGTAQNAKNLTSQNGKDGRVDAGTFQVAPSTDDDAYQNASWQVATHSYGNRVRYPSLPIDLISQGSTFQGSVQALTSGSLVALTGMPSQAPANNGLFIEGGHEVIGAQSWSVEFFTSPQTLESNVFILGTSTLGSSRVLAF